MHCVYICSILWDVGQDSEVGIVTHYGQGGLETAPIQAGSCVHPPSSTVGIGLFLEVKWSGHGVNHSSHLALSFKKE